MTNLYEDLDSKRMDHERAVSVFAPENMKYFADDSMPSLIEVVLHEATHNLGPYSDYRIDGKKPGEIFGGQMASTLEELKGQTGAIYYTELLRKKGIAKAANKAERETKEGRVYTYIHSNGRVGAMVEVLCETDFVARTEQFTSLCHDLAMHIAAMNPQNISPDEISAELVAKEKEIWQDQLRQEGKPEQIWGKIMAGK